MKRTTETRVEQIKWHVKKRDQIILLSEINDYINYNRCGKKHLYKMFHNYGETNRNIDCFNHYVTMCKKVENAMKKVKLKNQKMFPLYILIIN